MMLHVVLHQLSKSGKLLPAIEVVVVSCVLDLNVGDGSISPAEKNEGGLEECCHGDQSFDHRVKALGKVGFYVCRDPGFR